MRLVSRLAIFSLCFGALAIFSAAEAPKEGPADPPKPPPPREGRGGDPLVDDIVARLMAFDKNKDGKLTRDEITDQRLLRLFDRADKNKDGVVTKEELTEMAKEMAAELGAVRERRGGDGPPDGPGPRLGGPPPGRGPGGPDDGDRGPGRRPDGPGDRGPGDRGPGDRGPGGRGPGGPGGFGRFGGFPQPGQILPRFLQDRLELTAEQKKKVEDLQKEVEGKLGKILTEEQNKQLKEMRDRMGQFGGGDRRFRGRGGFGPGQGGPGGPGGPGGRGPGGPGSPGGRPPADDGPPRPGPGRDAPRNP
jgi:hypothetical protein